jgi:hypothetical protein
MGDAIVLRVGVGLIDLAFGEEVHLVLHIHNVGWAAPQLALGTHPVAVVELVDRGVDGGLVDANAADCLEDLPPPEEGGKYTIWCTSGYNRDTGPPACLRVCIHYIRCTKGPTNRTRIKKILCGQDAPSKRIIQTRQRP